MSRTPPGRLRPPVPAPPLEQLLHDSRTMEDAPPELVRRAAALWPRPEAAAAPASAPTAQGWRRLLATLTFDAGLAAPLALGLRGDAAGWRQWLFTTAEHDVDLRLAAGSPGGLTWQLSGQVLGPERPQGVQLRAVDSPPSVHQAVPGELGDFHFDPVPAGRWQVSIDFDGWSIDLPILEWPLPTAP